MRKSDALNALGALSHSTRLDIFKLLLRAGNDGLPAGTIAAGVHMQQQNALSTHLITMIHAGLVKRRRDGGNVRYLANDACLGSLLQFLLDDDELRDMSEAGELTNSIAC
jgi:DNA-binding transcriptional ArsR family regulator